MSNLPDWIINRYAGVASLLLCGLCADWGWPWSALAWLLVAAILILWSVSDNEMQS
jgi:hypothetical protein